MLIKTVLLRFFRGVDREGAQLLEKSTSLVSSIVNGALLAAAWLFLPLENANWRVLRARFRTSTQTWIRPAPARSTACGF